MRVTFARRARYAISIAILRQKDFEPPRAARLYEAVMALPLLSSGHRR